MTETRLVVPAYDRSVDLYTYQDVIDHLTDIFEGETGHAGQRLFKRAVQMAYRKFPDFHKWDYYIRRGKITTIAPQTTGTIAYDHTGGTYERQLTLSGATFPSTDTHLYKVLIDNVQYDIEDYKSSTVVTLTVDSNPGQDITAGTSYNLYRPKYWLPVPFRAMATDLDDMSRSFTLSYVPPNHLLDMQASQYTPQEPNAYTIYQSGESYGGWVLEFAPPPNAVHTWEFFYRAMARPLKISEYSNGTLTTDGTNTVTGSETTWTSKMVGSVIRVPLSGTVKPGGLAGGRDDDSEPYDEQRVIVGVASATSLTVDSAISTRSGVAYTISDPIDMQAGSMTDAFLRQCESEYAQLGRRDDAKDIAVMAQRALILAMGADNRQDVTQNWNDRSNWSLRDWAVARPDSTRPLT